MKNRRFFYSHVVEIESIIVELNKMDLSSDEKHHLAQLIDANLHNTVLDVVLSELPEEEKQVFLQNVNRGDHEKTWEHLNAKVDAIEEKIKKAAHQLKTEMHEDLEEAKKKTND